MPRFLMFENFEMPHFSYLILKNFSMWSNFKTDKEPKMKLFDFWAFQNFTQILSHDKIIFHMLFGEFQITSRKSLNLKWKKNDDNF